MPFEDVWEEKEGALAKHYGEAIWTPAAFPSGLKGTVVKDTSVRFCCAAGQPLLSVTWPCLRRHRAAWWPRALQSLHAFARARGRRG
jgi:hypothetical protein